VLDFFKNKCLKFLGYCKILPEFLFTGHVKYARRMFKPLKAVALSQLNDRPPRMYGHAKQVHRSHEPTHGYEPTYVVYATRYAS
jgi:hypothetical protein